MKISIVGSGWVGTDVGEGFRKMGYEVIFYDIVDRELPNFAKDIDYAIKNSEISFICVPTLTNGRKLALRFSYNEIVNRIFMCCYGK